MNRPHKSRPLPPGEAIDPGEIVGLSGNSGRPAGTPVELIPAGPPLEIIEASPVPRLHLVIVLRVDPSTDPAGIALSVTRFTSAIQAADRKLRLVVDPVQSRVEGTEVTLVLKPRVLGTEGTERLAKMIGVVQEAAAAFGGATLTRVEVAPQR